MTISSTDPRVLATLLLALHDRLNTIRAPRWQRENISGFARVGWVKCPKCDGTAEARWKGRTVKCERCHGAGGWHGDPMMASKISRPVDTDRADTSLVAFTHRILDMGVPELDRLDHAIDVTLGLDLDEDLEENARTEARHDHPSTLQIWDALSIMLRDFPHHGGILYRVFVWAWTPERHLGEHDRELVDDALHILAETLKARSPGFRAPGWALRAVEGDRLAKQALWRGHSQWAKAKRQERRDLIAKWTAEGHTNDEISRRTGLSVRRVQQLRNGAQEAA